MNTRIITRFLGLGLTACGITSASAQGSSFTYQGQLADGAAPANGTYDLRFTLYDAASSGSLLGPTNTINDLSISNGIFTVKLDFGTASFGGANRWLQASIRPGASSGAYLDLLPRQSLTAAPYAITAGTLSGTLPATQLTGTLAASQLNGNYSGIVNMTNAQNQFAGDGSGLIGVNAFSLCGLNCNQFWKLLGNAGTTPGLNFLGTTDDKPLEIKVHNQRALRLEPNSQIAPNVIGGAPVNFVNAGVVGATISGGGAADSFGVVLSNSIFADFATIGGGDVNTIQKSSGGATIAGGELNTIEPNADKATIAGGLENRIQNSSTQATIGGGSDNLIGTNCSTATIAGGEFNSILQDAVTATIAGGSRNTIQTGAALAAIGGGESNTIQTNAQSATIAGGSLNKIQRDANFATIGGGEFNTIETNAYDATIAGGDGNHIASDSVSGSGAATIGGGLQNFIGADAIGATIGGGSFNTILPNAANATIPGGTLNDAAGVFSFAAGQRAKANHRGTFVWADSQASNFASTGTNQFIIRASGGVGIGAANPVAELDVRGSLSAGTGLTVVPMNSSNVLNLQVGITANGSANGITFVENTAGFGMKLGYDGSGNSTENKLVIYDNSNVPRFIFENGGNLGLGVSNPANPIEHPSGALLTAAGVWQNASDVNRKTAFEATNPRDVLAKLARLPVQSWRYTNEAATVRHIGPTAQAFKAAFGLGTDEKSIGTLDADGVALAAIQGLNQKLEDQLKEKDARIGTLEHRLADLEKLVSTLANEGASQ